MIKNEYLTINRNATDLIPCSMARPIISLQVEQ
jgi:hypothetical protein